MKDLVFPLTVLALVLAIITLVIALIPRPYVVQFAAATVIVLAIVVAIHFA